MEGKTLKADGDKPQPFLPAVPERFLFRLPRNA
jgi:hypothetical protein